MTVVFNQWLAKVNSGNSTLN